MPSLLDTPLELDPQVALRPEPFGALAYHYGTRRLVFMKHLDVVAVARQLGQHPSLSAALTACGIAEARWPSFAKAFASLNESEIVRERPVAG
ncbi:MAG: mycofactocin biosynthesis chaperone MftB [Ilumatobacteraceae bacterium]